MINKMEYIETNEQSYPFVSAVERCGLEKAGYIEKEYFMYGTANVYETLENDEIGIRAKDAPYVNRLIVRAP
ncbi:MAG: alpha/beta hydrolase domain-containing protein, partial [Christensenella sp.]